MKLKILLLLCAVWNFGAALVAVPKSVPNALDTTLLRVISEGDRLVLEISPKVLGHDLWFGSRVIELSAPKNISAGQTFLDPWVGRFCRQGAFLLLEKINTEDLWPVNASDADLVARNHRTPVFQLFELLPMQPGKQTLRIDLTHWFAEEPAQLCPLPSGFKQGKLEARLSGLFGFYNRDRRVNLLGRYYYTGGKTPFEVAISYSIALAPPPMQPRLEDDRIGTATVNKTWYQTTGTVQRLRYATRWRIEPRPEDVAKYRQGQSVVPAKPIVMYLDGSLPSMLSKFVKQGILDWNAAFEAIGFRDAIQVREFPKDAKGKCEDLLVSAFRYIPTTTANAMGVTQVDPRSGEIIQGDIFWYQNVVKLLQEWRFVQTAAADPRARGERLDPETLGELIRYAVAHEMGHVLGFQHNMRASFAYPLDSLRSPGFTQQYGTTASIMDYARNNFVAQPGDAARGVRMTPPPLGPYDYLAVEWLYKPIYEAPDPESERSYLNRLLVERSKDSQYLFAKIASGAIVPDPAAQADMLSDNPLRASKAGIENLRIIAVNLLPWTTVPNGTYDFAAEMYAGMLKQFSKYLYCTASYIGGVYYLPGVVGQHRARYTPVKQETSREALRFIGNQLILLPEWADRPELRAIFGAPTSVLSKLQQEVLTTLLEGPLLERLQNNETGYTSSCYLGDLSALLFRESTTVNFYTEALQLHYLDLLQKLAGGKYPGGGAATLVVRRDAQTELETLTPPRKRVTAAPERDLFQRLHGIPF